MRKIEKFEPSSDTYFRDNIRNLIRMLILLSTDEPFHVSDFDDLLVDLKTENGGFTIYERVAIKEYMHKHKLLIENKGRQFDLQAEIERHREASVGYKESDERGFMLEPISIERCIERHPEIDRKYWEDKRLHN
jgi:hypothetical protein